jgi:hypothetical protein
MTHHANHKMRWPMRGYSQNSGRVAFLQYIPYGAAGAVCGFASYFSARLE